MKDKKEQLPLTNEQIQAKKLQLITNEGENVGIVSRDEALRMAATAGLDLVLLAEHGKEGVPVAKIMNIGKVLYEKKKKKKQQKTIQIKEIKMRPKIGEHDFFTKIKQAGQFLADNKRVKITLSFRGREVLTKDERGSEFFQKINKSFEDLGLKNIAYEKDVNIGQFWSRIYYLKI